MDDMALAQVKRAGEEAIKTQLVTYMKEQRVGFMLMPDVPGTTFKDCNFTEESSADYWREVVDEGSSPILDGWGVLRCSCGCNIYVGSDGEPSACKCGREYRLLMRLEVR